MTSPDLSHIIAPLRSLAVPISSLNPDPENARKHGGQNLAAIKASLRDNGQYLPLIVQDEGMIVRVGNGRLQAAKELGWTHVAAAVVPLERVAAVKLALVDNRTSELAEWDFETLSSLLQELHSNEGDEPLFDLGWSSHELEPLLNAQWNPPAIDDDVTFETSSGGAGNKTKEKTPDIDTRVLVFSMEQWAVLIDALNVLPDADNDTIIAEIFTNLLGEE